MIFIFNWVISRFHVNFQWCSNSWHAILGCSSKRGVQVCVCVIQNDENQYDHIGYYLWIINDHDSETAFCWSHEDHPISFPTKICFHFANPKVGKRTARGRLYGVWHHGIRQGMLSALHGSFAPCLFVLQWQAFVSAPIPL